MSWDFKHLLKQPLFCLGLVGLLIVAAMYGLVPYGQGYGSVVASVLNNLWGMWQNAKEWEHCQMVPAIVLAIIYWKREESSRGEPDYSSRDFYIVAGSCVAYLVSCLNGLLLPSVISLLAMTFQVFIGGERFKGVSLKGSNGAAVLLVLAMLFYWIGYKIDVVAFSFLSLHFTVGALILWFFGWKFFKLLLFPYSFLLFAWPMPFLDAIAFKLRILMSALSYGFLNFIGIETIRSGTALVSAADYVAKIPQGARFSLDVADPCSGIRSLFALTMVTALLAYFTQNKRWKQWFLLLCSAPLAVAGNFVRILMLAFGTILMGSETAIGTEKHPSFYHMLSGFVVFIVALGGALLIGWILSGGWKVLLAVVGLNAIKWEELKKPSEVKDGY